VRGWVERRSTTQPTLTRRCAPPAGNVGATRWVARRGCGGRTLGMMRCRRARSHQGVAPRRPYVPWVQPGTLYQRTSQHARRTSCRGGSRTAPTTRGNARGSSEPAPYRQAMQCRGDPVGRPVGGGGRAPRDDAGASCTIAPGRRSASPLQRPLRGAAEVQPLWLPRCVVGTMAGHGVVVIAGSEAAPTTTSCRSASRAASSSVVDAVSVTWPSLRAGRADFP